MGESGNDTGRGHIIKYLLNHKKGFYSKYDDKLFYSVPYLYSPTIMYTL